MQNPNLRPITVNHCQACGSQWVAIHNCPTGTVLTAPHAKQVPPAIRGRRATFNWPADSEDN